MTQNELDTLLQLLLAIQKINTTPEIERIAKNLFEQLVKYRFSSHDIANIKY